MDFNAAIGQILMLFIIMFIGVIAKKRAIINDAIQDSISVLLIKISLPALMISSTNFERNSEVLPNMISILVITIASYILTIPFSMLAAKALHLDKKKSNVFISLIVFGNVGFMGFPIVKVFFGDIGVFYTIAINLVFTTFVWTYGILLFNSHEKLDFRKLLNIGTISCFIAIFMFIFDLRLPYPLQTALDLIGKMNTPLAMLLIGALIAEIDIGKLVSNKIVYLLSAIKLILVPLATAYVLKLSGFNNMVISLCTVVASMPSATTNAIFAHQFDSEPLFASIGVFITTLLSILTMPFIVYILTNYIL